MSYSIIVAVGKNREIGIDNKLPWNIPEDLRRFRNLTRGHTVIMGRKTFESIGKALPNRKNVIVTRNKVYFAEGCQVVNSLENALKATIDDGEVFIMGGAQIYREAMPYVEKMYITAVDAEFKAADTYFPKVELSEWRVVSDSRGQGKEGEPSFSYLIYERIKHYD